MTKTLMFEADAISGMDDLRAQLAPTVPALPFDEPLYAFDKKARDCNRLPARIMEDSWISKVATGNVVIVDEFTGEPAKLQKHVSAEPKPEIELSDALQARIRVIADNATAGLTKFFARSLAKVTPQALAKRVSRTFCGDADLADADPNFDQGRKVLSVERRGKAKITKFVGGERWEIVDD